jgi:hypothetical protein
VSSDSQGDAMRILHLFAVSLHLSCAHGSIKQEREIKVSYQSGLSRACRAEVVLTNASSSALISKPLKIPARHGVRQNVSHLSHEMKNEIHKLNTHCSPRRSDLSMTHP